jgi:hypothetical protein
LQWDDATGLPKVEASEECPIMWCKGTTKGLRNEYLSVGVL